MVLITMVRVSSVEGYCCSRISLIISVYCIIMRISHFNKYHITFSTLTLLPLITALLLHFIAQLFEIVW